MLRGLLSLLFCLLTLEVFAQSEAPIDLYLALDQSGSLSERRFRQLADFGQALSFGVADITGFHSEDSNGLRVGAVTFGCGGQTKERIIPTGDPDVIIDRVNNMKGNVKTYGETCLEGALQLLLGFKDDQQEISPPSRATALVVLSDGRFDDFDDCQDEIQAFRGDDTQSFSVGIGSKVRESEMIVIADNDPDKYFHVEDPDALPVLTELIASMVIDDFNLELIDTLTEQPISSDDDICAGQRVSVKLSGRSLQVYSADSTLTCDFIFKDIVMSVKARAMQENGDTVIFCDNPDVSAVYQDFTLEFKVNGNNVNSNTFDLQRDTCATVQLFFGEDEVSTFENCWGLVNASVLYSGQSAEILINQRNELNLRCLITYNNPNNEEVVLEGFLSESPSQLRCALPEELFESERIDADKVKLDIVASLEGHTSAALSTILDTRLRRDCLDVGIINQDSQPALCYGDNLVVTLSGQTVKNILNLESREYLSVDGCNIIHANDTKVETVLSRTDEEFSCNLPFQYGIFQHDNLKIEIEMTYLTGSGESLVLDLQAYTLSTCYDEGFPRKIVIQSTDGKRVENERFCAGDGYEIQFAGVTPQNVARIANSTNLEFELYCDFYRHDIPDQVLFRVSARYTSANQIVCEALVWNPYDVNASEFYDLSSVSLVLVSEGKNLDEGLLVDIYTGISFCFDDPDHQVPDGFAPPEETTLVSRQLQDQVSCFPFCCKRTNVSISFSGRTIAVVSAAQADAEDSRLRCVFTKTDTTTIETDIILNGDQATCEAAPGWKLKEDTGDYSLVELELVQFSGKIIKFSKFDYKPTTAAFSCVNNVPLNYYCLGEEVQLESYGLTLLAIADDPSLSYDEDLFDISVNSDSMELVFIDDERRTILSRWLSFDQQEVFNNQSVVLSADNILVHEETIGEIRVENLERCIDIQVAESVCILLDGQDKFITSVEGVGEAITFYPPETGIYSCKFSGATIDNITIEADVQESGFTCETDQLFPLSEFQVIFTNSSDDKEILLKQGDIDPPNDDCVSATGTPTGTRTETPTGAPTGAPTGVATEVPTGGATELPTGAPTEAPTTLIAGTGEDSDPFLVRLMTGILLCVLVSIIAMFAYRRRQEEKPTPIGSPKPPKFAVNDTIEVFLSVSKMLDEQNRALIEKGVTTEDDGFWFKGTIATIKPFDADSDNSSMSSGDIEAGIARYHLYDIALHEAFSTLNLADDLTKEVLVKHLKAVRSNFKVDDTVNYDAQDTLYKVDEILPNDSYTLVALDGSSRVIGRGDKIAVVTPLGFKKGDDVFVIKPESGYHKSCARIIEVDVPSQTYKVRTLGGEEFQIPSESVRELIFTNGQVVQVKNSSNDWKRATVKEKGENGEYLTIIDGSEEPVPTLISNIRLPRFSVNDRIEMLEENSGTEVWEPGYVESTEPKNSVYKVHLTRIDEKRDAKPSHLRKLELDEVMNRVRERIPRRSENIDSSIPDTGENIIPKEKRFKIKKPIDFRELPNHQFDITVNSSKGLGVKFGWTDEKVIVAGFNDMPDGDWGALEATGLVMIKDQLIRIDDEVVANYGVSDISDLLKKSKEKESVVLRFGRNKDYIAATSKSTTISQT